jgi:4-amino-4-deoxy-L-arabinose transferase-like glycosyltransferase
MLSFSLAICLGRIAQKYYAVIAEHLVARTTFFLGWNLSVMSFLPAHSRSLTIHHMPEIAAETPVPQQSSADQARVRLMYILLFLTGFLLRFGFVLWRKTYVSDPGSILPFGLEICSIAAHIVRGQGFSSPFLIDTGPTAWIAPVYPYMVAVVFRIFGIFTSSSALVILWLQCMMAGCTCVTICALGRRTIGWKLGLWSAWIFALSPIFYRWPVSWIWDFSASALLLSLACIITLDTAQRGTTRLWLLLAATWALSALTNPALISIMPFSFLYAAYVRFTAHREWLKQFVLAGVLFTAFVSPWLIRNYVVFGHPVFFRGNYWFEFHLGNYHYSNGIGFSGKHPTQNAAELKKYADWGEQNYIAYYKADSLHFVKQYPAEFLDLTRHRIWWFWDGTPLLYQSREWWKPWEFWPLSVLGWLGILFAVTRRPRGWFLFVSILLIYPLPYYFSYPVAKYRHAIEPELLMLSVYFSSVLYDELRGVLSRRNPAPSAVLSTSS